MDNPVLENNLNYIERYDKALADEIRSVTELRNDISLSETDEFEPNLIFNGLEIHARTGAEAEAKAVWASVSNDTELSIHVVFGLGLGYLFREVVKSTNGAVILYEPNLEILRATLEIVDFTPELSAENVFVVNKIDKIEKKYDILFAYGSETKFEFLNFYKFVFEKQMKEVLDKLGRLQSIFSQNSVQRKSSEGRFLLYSLYAMALTLRFPMLKELEGRFKDVPAIIVGAGASLGKNIETIKKYADKALIFGVTTSSNVLNEHGIAPDFVSAIETFAEAKLLENTDFEKTALIIEPYVHPNIVKLPFKYKFMTCSEESDANAFWAGLKGISRKDYESKGTVSYNALFAAKMLGCNPIILIGQDFAYVDGRCYSHDSAFKDLLCVKNEFTGQYEIKVDNFERYKEALYASTSFPEEAREAGVKRKIETLQRQLFLVDGQNGEKIPSSNAFAIFIEYFKTFAQNYGSQIKLYNASKGGADIEGFENALLEDILKDFPDLNIDISDYITESQGTIPFDKAGALPEIRKEVEVVQKAVSQTDYCLTHYYAMSKELQSRNVVTESLLQNLKKALGSYISISEAAANSSLCYRIVTCNSKTAIDYALKTCKDAKDIKSVSKMAEALKDFYEDDLNTLKAVLPHLTALKEKFEYDTAASKG